MHFNRRLSPGEKENIRALIHAGRRLRQTTHPNAGIGDAMRDLSVTLYRLYSTNVARRAYQRYVNT